MIELTWDDSANNGQLTGGDVAITFEDLFGIVRLKYPPNSHSLKISVVEKFDIRISEATEGQANMELGFLARHFKENLEFGSWYFATNNEYFAFRPNVENIRGLLLGRTVTSTLSVIVVNNQSQFEYSPVSIAVTITAPSKNVGEGPFISISAYPETATAGESIQFQIASTSIMQSNISINIQFNQDGVSVIWKLPKSFAIASGESEYSFSVLTHNFGFGTNDTVTISATVMDGNGYEVSADYGPAEVTVIETSCYCYF